MTTSASLARSMTVCALALTATAPSVHAQTATRAQVEDQMYCAALVIAGRAISRYMVANNVASDIPQQFAASIPDDSASLALQLRAWEMAGCDDPIVDIPDLAVEMMQATSSTAVDAMGRDDIAALTALWENYRPQLICTQDLTPAEIDRAQQMVARGDALVCGYRPE